jgi:hypothetical protein
MLVNYNDHYRHYFPSLYLLVNTNIKIHSIYTEGMMKGIIMRFKKKNHTVMWYLYRQNDRRSY